MVPLRTVIVPVAGLGTRLYPLTRRIPKALVPVSGVPLIEYVFREAHTAGFRTAVVVVAPTHRSALSRYCERARRRFRNLRFRIALQTGPFGSGDAVLRAMPHIGAEPCAVRFCDDLLTGSESVLASFTRLYRRLRSPLILLERVSRRVVRRYGVVGVQWSEPPLHRVRELVELSKMQDRTPPSTLAVVGAYVLTPRLMEDLAAAATIAPPLKDSLLINLAFHEELLRRRPLYGWEFPGRRFDCGNPEGLRSAEIFARTHRI